MKNNMRTAASIIVLFFLGIILPIALIMTRVDRYVLRPEPLLGVIEEQHVVERLPDILSAIVLEEYPDVVFLKKIDTPNLLHTIFSSQWVTAHLGTIVSQLFDLRLMGAEIAEQQIVLDLTEPKRNAKNTLTTMIPTLVAQIGNDQSLPFCDFKEYSSSLNKKNDDPDVLLKKIAEEKCRLPEEIQQMSLDQSGNIIDNVLVNVPNHVDLGQMIVASLTSDTANTIEGQQMEARQWKHANNQLSTFQHLYRTFRLFLFAIWLVIVLSLAFLLLMHYRRPLAMLSWLGSVLLSTGLVTMLAMFLFTPMSHYFFRQSFFLNLPSAVQPLVRESITAYLQGYTQVIFFIAIALLVSAMVSFGTAAFFRQRKKRH